MTKKSSQDNGMGSRNKLINGLRTWVSAMTNHKRGGIAGTGLLNG